MQIDIRPDSGYHGRHLPDGARMPKRNPYLNRSMIRSANGFFGRSRELDRAMACIGAATPQSVSVVGERRVGKSSFLWHLAQEEVRARYLDEPDACLFVYVDYQGHRHLDLEGFCRAFSRQLAQVAGERLAVAEAADLSCLEARVRQLSEAGLRLVGLFDEFETVTRSSAFGAEFFGFLRFLANSYPVAYVTASRLDLQSLCRSQEISESPFFNIFSRVALGALDADAAARLIAEPSAAAGVPLGAYAGQIAELGGHLPLFLQMACSSAFECLVEDDAFDAGRVARRFREEADGHFQYLWEHLDDGERDLLQALLTGRDAPGTSAGALRRLEQMGCVRRQGPALVPFSACLGPALRERGVLDEEVAGGVEEVLAPAAVAQEGPAPEAGSQVLQLEPVAADRNPYPEIVGRSVALRRVFAFIERAAASDVTVLLLGETGTGKELVARTIHRHSARCDRPFLVVNCGAIAEHLQESELFGHRKGAFTDAVDDREGLFEAADGGTLLLDEIAETTPATQVKLLRVLQEGEIRRVGDSVTRRVDVRVLGATNRDLEAEVASGRFREDLYYRLFVLVAQLPPLRERREDIPRLVEHLVPGTPVSPRALDLLVAYDWPGNVRELENQLAAAAAVAAGSGMIRPEHLWPRIQRLRPVAAAGEDPAVAPSAAWSDSLSLRQAREVFERELVLSRLRQLDWNHGQVADSLEISRSRLYELVRKHDLDQDPGS